MRGLEKKQRQHTPGLIWAGVVFALASIISIILLFQWNDLRAEESQAHVPSFVVMELSQIDLGVDWTQFWPDAGFLVLSKEDAASKHAERAGDQLFTWNEEVEEWFLVPAQPGASLDQVFPQLVADLLSKDQRVVLERTAEGYSLGSLVRLPGANQYITAKTWRFYQVNPLVMRNAEGTEPADELASQAPRLAVVIDDWGYDSLAARQLLDYPFPLTIAVLPYMPASAKIANAAAEKGHEVILHQPMEPLDTAISPGPGAIYLTMNEDEIRTQLMANLQHLPVVAGLNNHMGSRATSDTRVMQNVFEVLRDTELFFLDSYTIHTSVAGQVAEEYAVPYAVNDLFIDNINEEEQIMSQIRQGIELARRKGSAIIIGHVRINTAQALWRMLPEIITSGVQLVPVSALLQNH